MQQGDFQSQYSYSPQPHYAVPKRGLLEKIFGDRGARIIKSPLVATTGLLATGALLAFVIVSAYPEGSGDNSNIPIVQADAGPFKSTPIEAGGMEIPGQDNTIFESLQSAEAGATAGRIENLLEPAAGELEKAEPEPPAMPEKMTRLETPKETPKEMPKPVAKAAPKPAVKAPAVAKAEPKPPETVHTPGSSPETLAFVRSVLEQKESGGTKEVNRDQQPTAKALSDVAPAAGPAATSGNVIAGGDYFVQLSSITNEAAAPQEWSKLQNAYSGILGDADYRVQQKDLGERGVFYRIQAGPFPKEQASAICGQIKAQKPGGCFILK